MDNSEAIKLLKGNIPEWNARRKNGWSPNLGHAVLANVSLAGANLSGLKLFNSVLAGSDLTGADLSDSDFSDAHLERAVFRGANLSKARLFRCQFARTDCTGANFDGANLYHSCLDFAVFDRASMVGTAMQHVSANATRFDDANCDSADFGWSGIYCASFRNSDLRYCNLSFANCHRVSFENSNLLGANLGQAMIQSANLARANFRHADVGGTAFCGLDFSDVVGLDDLRFHSPCTLGLDTIEKNKGRFPRSFLLGCGLNAWQMLDVRMCDPTLSLCQLSDLQTEIYNERTAEHATVGGTFISYSHADRNFVDGLYQRLRDRTKVWLDVHDLVSGPTQAQVDKAIRLSDAVVVVFSKNSIGRDWIRHEVKVGRQKEKRENRHVVCPIALDESWKPVVVGDAEFPPDVDFEFLSKVDVISFSDWGQSETDAQVEKLCTGLRRFFKRSIS